MTDEDVDAPTCYRHPDRETYVRCTRCDRPICPDCMKDAAVGFQCPECVKEGNKSVRQARTIGGGRPTDSADLTKLIIGACVLAFFVQNVSDTFTFRFSMVGLLVSNGDYYRMLTVTFLHANVMHIAFNMYALYLFGQAVEMSLGRLRFAVLYVTCALGASVASYVGSSPFTTSVGASGAVFGMFGAYFVIARRIRLDTSQITMLILFNLVIGFVLPQIDWRAHLGGLVVGAAMTYVWVNPKLRGRAPLQLAATIAVIAVLAAITVVRTNQIREDCGLKTGVITSRCQVPNRAAR